MRLLIAILEERKALEIRLRLYGMDERWDIGVAADGAQAALLLKTERWDALLLDSRLRADGASLWETLCQAPPLCPPRVLALWQDGPRRRRTAPYRRKAAASESRRCCPCLPKSRCRIWQRLTGPESSGRRNAFWMRWACAGNGRDGAMRPGACAAGSPSPGWISSPSTGCTRNAPKPSGSAPERWSAAFASPWRACSPWAVSPTSSASSARPSTRTRASPPTGPF